MNPTFFKSIGILIGTFVLITTGRAQDLNTIPFQLPLFVIDTDGSTIVDEPKVYAHLGIVNNADSPNFYGDTFNEYDGNIGIEIRGNGSQNFAKKSYLFETRQDDGSNLNVELLGLPEENDWILYGPFIDITGMRNVLTYELARTIGSYASRTEYIEVILNDEYLGVYLLTEKLKRDKNRVDVEKFPEEENPSPTAGGYFLRIDSGWTPEKGWQSQLYVEGDTSWQIPYQYIYPKVEDITEEQASYIQNYITKVEQGFFSPSANGLESHFEEYVNLEAFIDMFIINELTKNPDGYRLSSFMTVDPTAEDPRVHFGPVWDYNFGYGNYVNNFGVTKNWEYDNHWWPIWERIPFWWGRAIDDEFFRNALVCRWRELRKNIITEERFHSQIDAINERIREGMLRNQERWPGEIIPLDVPWASSKDYDTEVQILKDWIPGRIKWLDRHINALSPDKLLNFTDGILRPNPTYNGFTLDLKLDTPQDFDINIYDTSGRKMYSKTTSLIAGFQRIEVYDAVLAPGTYLVAIQSEDSYFIEKLVCL